MRQTNYEKLTNTMVVDFDGLDGLEEQKHDEHQEHNEEHSRTKA